MLARPAIVLLVIAVALPIMAVRTITAGLVFFSAVYASLFVAVQIATAFATIVSAPGRKMGAARAFDLWFAGHVPYTAWILMLPFITAIPSAGPLDAMIVTLAVPALWSTFVMTAFCRNVLGDTPARARWRTAIHETVTLGALTAYGLWSAGGVDAVNSYVLRMAGRI
ncbi:MAG TPA: hypothetical protein VN628_02345 [Vicinamibacterales bacterium]|nr:hypothetical protein [Vicinamibacterales bacterium]